jgi:hypothetical protein
MEAPENWDLTWVCGHRLEEGPDQHQEQDMENYQQNWSIDIIFQLWAPYHPHIGVINGEDDNEHEEHK